MYYEGSNEPEGEGGESPYNTIEGSTATGPYHQLQPRDKLEEVEPPYSELPADERETAHVDTKRRDSTGRYIDISDTGDVTEDVELYELSTHATGETTEMSQRDAALNFNDNLEGHTKDDYYNNNNAIEGTDHKTHGGDFREWKKHSSRKTRCLCVLVGILLIINLALIGMVTFIMLDMEAMKNDLGKQEEGASAAGASVSSSFDDVIARLVALEAAISAQVPSARIDQLEASMVDVEESVEDLVAFDGSLASIYLTQANADSTYLTQANAGTTYLTQATAGTTYLTQGDASSTYLAQANAVTLLQQMYPVGSTYTNVDNSGNPAGLLGFGTWTRFSDGRVMVGGSSGATGGSNFISLTEAHLPAHSHVMYVRRDGDGEGGCYNDGYALHDRFGNDACNLAYRTEVTGNGSSFDIRQPYVVVHIWTRTS